MQNTNCTVVYEEEYTYTLSIVCVCVSVYIGGVEQRLSKPSSRGY